MQALHAEDKVISILAQRLELEFEEIEPTSKLIEDLGADDLDLAEIIMLVEEEFEIVISDEEVGLVKTVQDIVDLIEQATFAPEPNHGPTAETVETELHDPLHRCC